MENDKIDEMNDLLASYSYIPSLRVIATGAIFGLARTICGHALRNRWFFVPIAGTMPTGALIICTIALRCIFIPFLEEFFFRKDLNDPSASQIFENSFTFGLMHGLLPGSMEERVTRVAFSTIGGFFYCGARIVGGDVWSSAIAHSMYNLVTINGSA